MSRGRFYLRCESDEWDFIRALDAQAPFDAAVISDRYLSDYPDGHARCGEPRDRLPSALDTKGIYWSVDPDTARLEHPKSTERQRARAANRPLARALRLPLTPELFASRDAIHAIVEAGTIHQLGSRALAAPYFEVSGPDDPRFAVNRRLLTRTRELAGDRAVVAYLQVLRSDLRNGNAASAAELLAGSGAEVLFLRVRRLDAEHASTDDVLAYAGVVGAGVRTGARVVADCVGRLGPVLIATGADGFASNAWCFRRVSADLHPGGGGGGAGELLWEIPGALTGLPSSRRLSGSSWNLVGDPDGLMVRR